jgi:hypothetical protein
MKGGGSGDGERAAKKYGDAQVKKSHGRAGVSAISHASAVQGGAEGSLLPAWNPVS